MQKNKFICPNIKAICSGAAKKLMTFGLVAALGSAAIYGNSYGLIAKAQTTFANSYNDTALSQSDIIQDIKASMRRVMNQFALNPSDLCYIIERCYLFSDPSVQREQEELLGFPGIIDELDKQIINKFGLSNQQLINFVKNMVHFKK